MTLVQQPTRIDVKTPSMILRFLLVFLGALLPMVSLLATSTRGELAVGERVTMADLAILCLFIWLVPFGLRRAKLHPAGLFYLAAILIAGVIGVGSAGLASEKMDVIEATVALLMAFLYWLIGYSIGENPVLVRSLVFGLAVGACWEAVIALHDFLLPGAQWFPDPMLGRVRGTFRTNGQLAAYGFSTSAILLSVGWLFPDTRRTKTLVVIAGLLGAFCAFAASRRSVMFAVAATILFFLVLGSRHLPERGNSRIYVTVLLVVVCLALLIGSFPDLWHDTFTVRRIESAVNSVQEGEAFDQLQFGMVMERFSVWFPLGVGIGRAMWTIDPYQTHELHSTHLALIVEAGLMGFLAFYWTMAVPILHRWKQPPDQSGRLAKTIMLSFLASAFLVMMVHNRLHRDRGFMLFLGLASSIAPNAQLTEASDYNGND